MRHIIFTAAIAVTAVGCGGSLHQVVDAHDAHKGTTEVIAAPLSRVWDETHAYLHEEGAGIDDHQAEGYCLASIETTTFRYGAFIGVWLTPSGPDHTTVDVVTRRNQIGWAKALTERTFLDELAKRVASPSAAPAATPATPPSSAVAPPTSTK